MQTISQTTKSEFKMNEQSRLLEALNDAITEPRFKSVSALFLTYPEPHIELAVTLEYNAGH